MPRGFMTSGRSPHNRAGRAGCRLARCLCVRKAVCSAAVCLRGPAWRGLAAAYMYFLVFPRCVCRRSAPPLFARYRRGRAPITGENEPRTGIIPPLGSAMETRRPAVFVSFDRSFPGANRQLRTVRESEENLLRSLANGMLVETEAKKSRQCCDGSHPRDSTTGDATFLVRVNFIEEMSFCRSHSDGATLGEISRR